ncbi:MAG: M61 family metallopeptidase, partial [Vicinamibacterales bacterium]
MAKRFLTLLIVIVVSVPAWAQAPAIEYTLSFPAPEHRWMQVDVRFPNVPAGPLQVRMARSSPGRYALHDFAKNVFDVSIVNGKGQPLTATRPDPHQWDVASHDGTVLV